MSTGTRELVDGATAIVRGALDAGCDFFAGYPITPASQILMAMMRELPARGGVAVQGEDEIASIGMCIGAAMTGARAMTATSGPGISLYSEHLGLAVMGEVPLVVVDVQRLGPATGGATTAAQGDVQFVRWGTSGGYPVVVLAPASIGDCYHLTRRAFELAERFRTPVFLLTDKELNLTVASVEVPFAGVLPPMPDVPPRLETTGAPYRYEPAEAVPPLRAYGGDRTVRFTGSSHDEQAFITKDPAAVGALNRHLIEKIDAHSAAIEIVEHHADPKAEVLVVAFGITAGAALDAADAARRDGTPVSVFLPKTLWPIPERALARALEGIRRVVVAELNDGQYRREIDRRAGPAKVIGVNRIDGELITPAQILEALR
jgi:2-oxoglutarate ferredoxin oxidoreductase subunit alpha